MSDSPKSRNLQKYRPKGSNPQDYNSVDLECGDSKVWSSLGTLVLITSLFSVTYFLAPRTAPVTWKSWAGISEFSSFWVKGIFGIKKWEISHVFPNEKRKKLLVRLQNEFSSSNPCTASQILLGSETRRKTHLDSNEVCRWDNPIFHWFSDHFLKID